MLKESPLFCFSDSALSEPLEELQELVCRLEAADSPVEWFCFGQSSFLEFEIGVQIHLRRVHGFVPQP